MSSKMLGILITKTSPKYWYLLRMMFPILLGDVKNYQRPDHAERTWGPQLFDSFFGTDFAQAVAE